MAIKAVCVCRVRLSMARQRARTGLLVRGECLRVLDSELHQEIALVRGEVVVRHALSLDFHDVLCTCKPHILMVLQVLCLRVLLSQH